MGDTARITSVEFDKFKALRHYLLSLEHLNVLAGPNNSGKSTIIGSIRALAAAMRVGRSRSPERVTVMGSVRTGYRIGEASLPISLENVHTEYGADDSRVTFLLNNGNRLHLMFPAESGCYLVPEVPGYAVTSPAQFKRHFPISLAVVPVLGPVEHREQLRELKTVVACLSTHRASRHFRSYWHYFPEEFERFADMVRRTWPGMEIQPPEMSDMTTGELSMFCLEDRMTRELYWSGFGFQIWCQLLTHLCRAHEASLIVVDEPEVYLHPDVQRQLISIMRGIGPDVLLATHSTEIMAEADPNDIVLVDKRKSSGERLRDLGGVQRALESVGSVQNITLTALARNRRVLFLKSDDEFKLLRRFARKLGMVELAAGLGITPLACGGLASWERITVLAEGIERALAVSIMIGAVYGRDYFSEKEISLVQAALAEQLAMVHVYERKEIENYLLVPDAIDRAVATALADRLARRGSVQGGVLTAASLLEEITAPLEEEVKAQVTARRVTWLHSNSRDVSDLTQESLASFAGEWRSLERRLRLVPGKAVLGALKRRIQSVLHVSLSDERIVDAMHKHDIAPDLARLLRTIDRFRESRVGP